MNNSVLPQVTPGSSVSVCWTAADLRSDVPNPVSECRLDQVGFIVHLKEVVVCSLVFVESDCSIVEDRIR